MAIRAMAFVVVVVVRFSEEYVALRAKRKEEATACSQLLCVPACQRSCDRPVSVLWRPI